METSTGVPSTSETSATTPITTSVENSTTTSSSDDADVVLYFTISQLEEELSEVKKDVISKHTEIHLLKSEVMSTEKENCEMRNHCASLQEMNDSIFRGLNERQSEMCRSREKADYQGTKNGLLEKKVTDLLRALDVMKSHKKNLEEYYKRNGLMLSHIVSDVNDFIITISSNIISPDSTNR